MRKSFLCFFFLGTTALCQMAGSGIPVLGSTNGSGIVGTCGSATGYAHTATITIQAQGSLSASSVSNYRMYFAGNANLTTAALSSGVDILFCTAENGSGTILSYEQVPSTFSIGTGGGKWWVLVPTVSKSSTNKIYLMWGNASASDQSCWPNEPSGTNSCGNSSQLWDTTIYARVYHYGNGSTLSLTDSSGTATSPTNHSAVAANTCELSPAGCVRFPGSGQWIDTGSTFNPTNFSVETWMENQAVPVNWLVNTCNSTSCTNGFGLPTYAPSTCTAGPSTTCAGLLYVNGANNYVRRSDIDFGGGGTTAKWMHFFGTHTSGSANVSLCVNGASDTGTVTNSGSPTDPSASATTLQLGAVAGTAQYTGYMDETRVYKTAFTTCDQALLDYNNQSSPTSFYTVSTP